MKPLEKDAVMEKFAAGDLDLLVATTVIEVGVNVPEATIMVIEHAERFGLSQLHQLRGRVGRGEKQSKCILLYSGKPTQRLSIMKKYDDGFKIAEEDLKLRGSGDILGTRQSGFAEFKFAEFPRDYLALEEARIEAKKAVSSGNLSQKHKLLLSLFEYDDSLDYISAG
jgi:ATP-dependent DNA helicase RecG